MSKKKPGSLRPSQLISTFGPGALVDFKDDSVMIMGLQDWHTQEEHFRALQEPRLASKLNVSTFLQPRSVKGKGGVPAISFPRYRVCSRCGSLRNDFDRDYAGIYYCDSCSDKKVQAYPARLIMACNEGHIDDFPWSAWSHGGKENICSSPNLFLKAKGASSALNDLEVICKTCKRNKSLGGALKKNALIDILGTCNGHSPWLRKSTRCNKLPRGLQRGASNVYFSSTISALSIPKWDNDIQAFVREQWNLIEKNVQKRGLAGLEIVLDVLFPEKSDSELAEIFTAIKQQYEMEENPVDIRFEEWGAFQKPEHKSRNFHIEEEEVHRSLKPFISRVVLAHRLREVRVLKGFTRIDYPDPQDDGEYSYNYLSNDTNIEWLPGVEILGEGIFIELNEDLLKKWEKDEHIKRRYNPLIFNYQEWRLEKGWEEDHSIGPRFILLHTLAHVLIRELSLTCGYSSNSIREKIYSGNNMHGILLYTGSPDSDGSLGGIIQQGRTEQFYELLKQAIERAKICSSDPLCSESENVVENSLNKAACHACSLISETSCEKANILLDRLSLVNIDENKTGYFSFGGSSAEFDLGSGETDDVGKQS